MGLGRVEASGGFFLLLAWMNYLDRQCLVPMALLACLLHELGHYVAITWLGGGVKLIRLTAVGAEMVLDRPLGYWQEGVAALAGPGVNLALALLFCALPGGAVFAGLNLVLACFNMLPVGRLDGGRALSCALSLLLGPDWAWRVGRGLDVAFGVLLLLLGGAALFGGENPTLLLVALWVVAGITREKTGGKRRNGACHPGEKRV